MILTFEPKWIRENKRHSYNLFSVHHCGQITIITSLILLPYKIVLLAHKIKVPVFFHYIRVCDLQHNVKTKSKEFFPVKDLFESPRYSSSAKRIQLFLIKRECRSVPLIFRRQAVTLYRYWEYCQVSILPGDSFLWVSRKSYLNKHKSSYRSLRF